MLSTMTSDEILKKNWKNWSIRICHRNSLPLTVSFNLTPSPCLTLWWWGYKPLSIQSVHRNAWYQRRKSPQLSFGWSPITTNFGSKVSDRPPSLALCILYDAIKDTYHCFCLQKIPQTNVIDDVGWNFEEKLEKLVYKNLSLKLASINCFIQFDPITLFNTMVVRLQATIYTICSQERLISTAKVTTVEFWMVTNYDQFWKQSEWSTAFSRTLYPLWCHKGHLPLFLLAKDSSNQCYQRCRMKFWRKIGKIGL